MGFAHAGFNVPDTHIWPCFNPTIKIMAIMWVYYTAPRCVTNVATFEDLLTLTTSAACHWLYLVYYSHLKVTINTVTSYIDHTIKLISRLFHGSISPHLIICHSHVASCSWIKFLLQSFKLVYLCFCSYSTIKCVSFIPVQLVHWCAAI